jgi:hypothetical protein
MTIGESHAFCGQAIKVRCFDTFRTLETKVFVTEVVGKYQNDIWLLGGS